MKGQKMKCMCFYTIGVVLLSTVSVLAVPVSDVVDQVPPLPEGVTSKDDGSVDLKPPPPQTNDNQYSGSSSISAEASVFDPSIYSGLLPGGLPGYPDPYPGGYPQPYPSPYGPPPGYPTPYVVQTGYEGYLVPSAPAPQAVALPDPLGFLRGLIPQALMTWIVRSMALIMGTITVVVMGGAVTTALCSLTPICSISFKSLKFLDWNDTARNVGIIVGKEITSERVRRAASFVRTAIKKYSELQKALMAEDEAVDKKDH